MISSLDTLPLLSIALFGPMTVRVDGEPLPPVRSRKILYLLALLTLRHGRPVEREWLAGTLWPDADQSQAFANLRPALSQLRSALGSASSRLVAPSRHTLQLDLSNAQVDVLTFDAAIATKRRSDLERAVSLYRGPLLEGCAEEWILQDREARTQAVLRTLQTLATSAQETGNHETAADWWRRAVMLDPLWEVARRGLMSVLAGSGDTNTALQVYREFTVILQSDDPRAAPDTETTALYRRLRDSARQKAAVSAVALESDAPGTEPPTVSGYLPCALNELVGREDERLEIADRLRCSRLVTLTGPGGIGKTRLAAAAAGDVIRGYPEGVWLVGLESLRTGGGVGAEEGQPVAQQVASVLGIKVGAGRPLLPTVVEWLRRKRLLLVLDNCEHLLDATACVVAPILRECLGVRILTTSRETLGVRGETVWSVPPLAAPDPETLPKGKTAQARALAGYDSVHLFVERAQAVNKNFTLTGENARDVALLCSRLDGLPLALELAAARTVTLSPAQILAQLDTRPLDALTSRQRDIAPRHRTLRATLEWSYSLLPTEAQTFLADMSVFRGGWTLEAAQAVSPDADTVEMLTLLHNASLVAVSETDTGSRFAFLETVRQFAAEQLEGSERADAVKRRFAVHFTDWLLIPTGSAFYKLTEREYANLLAVLDWGIEAGKTDVLLIACTELAIFWEHTGRNSEGQKWMDIVSRQISWETAGEEEYEEHHRGQDRDASNQHLSRRQRFLMSKEQLCSITGDMNGAAEASLQMFEETRRAGDPIAGRTFLYNAGIYLLTSDLHRALAIFEQCLPLERKHSNDGQANPIILARLTDTYRLTGQSDRAAAMLKEALKLCYGREKSDPLGCAMAQLTAGRAAMMEGDHSHAADCFRATVTLAEQLGVAFVWANALCCLAVLARERGDQEWEESLVAQAIVRAGPTPHYRLIPTLQQQQEELLLLRGDIQGATALAHNTLTLFRGKSASFRLALYPHFLLLAEAELLNGSEIHRAEWVARLVGAAGTIARRLGLVAPERSDNERAARLRTALARQLGTERLIEEEVAGAALDDEAALEFALMPL
ncbi:MAG: hypothetical protein H7145_11425 [Akkermansiaceae bacterium]|nr:hypothetical protein [Armatimonadota bacterium]